MTQPRNSQNSGFAVQTQFDDFVMAVVLQMEAKNFKINKETGFQKSVEAFLRDPSNSVALTTFTNFIQNEVRAKALSLFGTVEPVLDLEISVSPTPANDPSLRRDGQGNEGPNGASLNFKTHPFLNNVDGMPASLPAWLVASAFELHQEDSAKKLSEKLELKQRMAHKMAPGQAPRPEEPRPVFQYTVRPRPPGL